MAGEDSKGTQDQGTGGVGTGPDEVLVIDNTSSGGDQGGGDSGGIDEGALTPEEQAFYQGAQVQPGAGGNVDEAAGETPPGAKVNQPQQPAAGEEEDDDDDGEDAGQSAGGEGTTEQGGRVRRRPRWSNKKYQELLRRAETAENERNALRTDFARADERFKIIEQAMTAPKPQQEKKDDDPEPDIEVDFLAHAQWLGRQNKQLAERLERMESGAATEREQREAQQQLSDAYNGDAENYTRANPEFPHAYTHLMNSRVLELSLALFGKDLTDKETPRLTTTEAARIRKEISREENALASNAIKSGRSPAAQLHLLAKMRGFVMPAAAAGQEQQQQPQNGQAADHGGGELPGSLASEAAKLPGGKTNGAGKVDVSAELDRVRRGAEASTSLSQGGGGGQTALTFRKLADMQQDEFGHLVETLSPDQLMRLMGGASE